MSESTPASGGMEVTFDLDDLDDVHESGCSSVPTPGYYTFPCDCRGPALVAEVGRLREVVHASDLAVTRYTQRALVAEGEVERILGLLEDVNDEAGRLRERVRWLEARIATTGIPD